MTGKVNQQEAIVNKDINIAQAWENQILECKFDNGFGNVEMYTGTIVILLKVHFLCGNII